MLSFECYRNKLMFTTYFHLKLICVGIDSIFCHKQVISFSLGTII